MNAGVAVIQGGPAQFATRKSEIGAASQGRKDHDDAVAVAAKWPSARLGTIEVRPLEEGLSTETRYGTSGAA